MKKFSNIKESKFKKQALNIKQNQKHLRIFPNHQISMRFRSSRPISEKSLLSCSYHRDCLETPKKRKELLREERAQAANVQIARETLRRMKKLKTQGTEVEPVRNMDELKEYIRGVTAVCNKIQKKTISRTKLKDKIKPEDFSYDQRFIFEQLSFSQIYQAKIVAQRLILKDHKEPSQIQLQNIQEGKYQKSKIIESLKIIDKVYKSMQQMEELGYIKLCHKYMIDFCKNTRLWMIDIFLYELQQKGQNFSLNNQYLVVSTQQQAKQNFASFIAKGANRQLELLQEDLEELLNYLDDVLEQTKLLELTKMSDYTKQKLQSQERGEESRLRFKYVPRDKLNLKADLEVMQKKYGNMKEISKVSRRRYENLNQTYQRLKTLL